MLILSQQTLLINVVLSDILSYEYQLALLSWFESQSSFEILTQ